MMWSISRSYVFSAAHRLEGHPKCGRMHGHNYEVEVSITVDRLPKEEWVLDYAQLDAIVKPMIDEMDHRYIVTIENMDAKDEYTRVALEKEDACALPIARSTVECMSQFLANEIDSTLELMGLVDMAVAVSMAESARSQCVYVK
jgi:6-pyruvoyltetrahydropterin/6-carboxytetrahydropterin synthase